MSPISRAQPSSLVSLILVGLAALLPGPVAAAQDAIFSDGFEWGDTADWAATRPVRCDRLVTFDRGVIARNFFHELSANAVQSKGGSEDIEIRWNRFVESGQRSLNLGGSTGFEFFRPPLSDIDANAEARDLRVVANVFEGSEAAVAYVGCVGCVVVNNTIVDPHSWILRILQETTSTATYEFEECRDGEFLNNLVHFDRSDLSTYVNVGPNTQPSTFVFANNLWYAWDNPVQSQPTLPVTESEGIYGVDPAMDADFRIDRASPAARAGLVDVRVPGDLVGACYASPPSIGAFEAR